MTSRIPSQCRACARFDVVQGNCDAFLGGVPADMLFYGDDHRKPRDRDGGIQFLQGRDPEQLQAFQDWVETFG